MLISAVAGVSIILFHSSFSFFEIDQTLGWLFSPFDRIQERMITSKASKDLNLSWSKCNPNHSFHYFTHILFQTTNLGAGYGNACEETYKCLMPDWQIIGKRKNNFGKKP
eukprot:TRINITY_DN19096_c0_g1_i1.p1 TRINITY_DN19096_c0_g1~~TRINITY_DN19096_c0_g1_i1.p1  ORF type:complete len:110 (+),score=3.01 TRINITY_DN19096_c0_g1_i1:137-466(+)